MYKYRFHYLLRRLPLEEMEAANNWLPERLCISRKTWERWVYLKDDVPTELPLFRLEQIASFFGVTVKDLHTNPRKAWNLKEEFHKENSNQ